MIPVPTKVLKKITIPAFIKDYKLLGVVGKFCETSHSKTKLFHSTYKELEFADFSDFVIYPTAYENDVITLGTIDDSKYTTVCALWGTKTVTIDYAQKTFPEYAHYYWIGSNIGNPWYYDVYLSNNYKVRLGRYSGYGTYFEAYDASGNKIASYSTDYGHILVWFNDTEAKLYTKSGYPDEHLRPLDYRKFSYVATIPIPKAYIVDVKLHYGSVNPATCGAFAIDFSAPVSGYLYITKPIYIGEPKCYVDSSGNLYYNDSLVTTLSFPTILRVEFNELIVGDLRLKLTTLSTPVFSKKIDNSIAGYIAVINSTWYKFCPNLFDLIDYLQSIDTKEFRIYYLDRPLLNEIFAIYCKTGFKDKLKDTKSSPHVIYIPVSKLSST